MALVAIAAPVRAADGGAGGVGDAASIGNGGNGGQTGSAGTAGGQGLGGGGAGGTAGLPPGGNGGTGASGFNTSPGIGAAGGGGGGGASGNSMFSFGGVGGNGGNAAGTVSTGYGGGGGGGGGNGVDVVDFPTNDTPSIGGRGGNGGNAGGSSSGAGNGGSGGAGGYGVGLFTYSFTNVAGVTIGGGGGGNGGSGSGMQSGGVPGNGGAGGVGGAGIVASFANIFNAGTISGGNGGAGGNAGTTGAAGVAGAGGVGIIGDRLTIVNSGAITGGLAGDGVTRANAITFTGGTNSLKLEAGYQITGNVQAASRADVLVIGGRADSQFSVNNLGDTSQYRGFGRLLKTDASTWTVSGRTDFNGPFDIEAGTVRLGGFLSNTRVTVGRASLVGSGEIGSLDARAGSIISPGRGTDRTRFDVNGDVTFRQGSTFQVNVNNSGLSDIIRATGNATLEGGRVEVMAEDASNYNRTTNATILTASRVTGQFAEVTSDLAFLTPSLSYGPDRVELVLTRNDASFRSVATTPNQQQIAGAIAALGINDPVLIAVLKQNPDGARAAFDILNGEAGPSSITQQFELMSIFSALMMGGGPAFGGFGGEAAALFAGGEVEASYAADMPGRTPTTTRMPIGNLDPKMFSMWGSGFGSFGSTSSNGNAGALTRDVAGFVVGVDATFDQMYRIGVAGGFTRSNFDIRSRASSGESDTGFGAIYGGARFGPVTLRLGGLFAGMSSDTRRAIVFPGFADNVTAQFGGTGLLGFGEVGYRFDVGTVGIEPFVGGSGMRLSRDGYTERGGPAALTVLQRDYDIQTFTAGVRASARLSADSPFTVRGQLAYRRAFGDVVPTALLAFAGGGTQFQTAGIPIDVNALVAEAGIGWQATKDVALELAYTGQVGQRAEDHGVKGSFLWKF